MCVRHLELQLDKNACLAVSGLQHLCGLEHGGSSAVLMPAGLGAASLSGLPLISLLLALLSPGMFIVPPSDSQKPGSPDARVEGWRQPSLVNSGT